MSKNAPDKVGEIATISVNFVESVAPGFSKNTVHVLASLGLHPKHSPCTKEKGIFLESGPDESLLTEREELFWVKLQLILKCYHEEVERKAVTRIENDQNLEYRTNNSRCFKF